MQKTISKTNFFLRFLISIVAWFAILLQFYLIILNRVTSIPETIIRFFSFFTIQTNILVAVCFTCLWLKPKSKAGEFFYKTQNSTAITVYIIIVGLVYNTILRFLWAPSGWQKVVDELLHSVLPVLVLVYWIIFVCKEKLRFTLILGWLIFPFLYLIYVLLRGMPSEFYPYPFINVTVLGYTKVFVNCLFMLLVFLTIGFLLIGFGKLCDRTKAK